MRHGREEKGGKRVEMGRVAIRRRMVERPGNLPRAGSAFLDGNGKGSGGKPLYDGPGRQVPGQRNWDPFREVVGNAKGSLQN